MPSVEVKQISKSFGDVKAVRDISFAVEPGEIFGLLGPNGSGKTTSIRVALDIYRPDSGSVAVFSGALTDESKQRIGYMPEERGLYQDVTIDGCVTYLAALKGLDKFETKRRLDEYCKRFDLDDSRNQKIKQLSKGMQQKVQIISTVIHEPELLIVDEPFSGLDPINTELVKALLEELRDKGTAILMSSHQLHQVEELCDRIVLINRGRSILSGDLDHIRREFAGDSVMVRSAADMPQVAGVKRMTQKGRDTELLLDDNVSSQQVLDNLRNSGVVLDRFEISSPSLDEIFIRAVGEDIEEDMAE